MMIEICTFEFAFIIQNIFLLAARHKILEVMIIFFILVEKLKDLNYTLGKSEKEALGRCM